MVKIKQPYGLLSAAAQTTAYELFALLYAMGGQVWITGTDQEIFINAAPETQFFTIEKGKIKQQ